MRNKQNKTRRLSDFILKASSDKKVILPLSLKQNHIQRNSMKNLYVNKDDTTTETNSNAEEISSSKSIKKEVLNETKNTKKSDQIHINYFKYTTPKVPRFSSSLLNSNNNAFKYMYMPLSESMKNNNRYYCCIKNDRNPLVSSYKDMDRHSILNDNFVYKKKHSLNKDHSINYRNKSMSVDVSNINNIKNYNVIYDKKARKNIRNSMCNLKINSRIDISQDKKMRKGYINLKSTFKSSPAKKSAKVSNAPKNPFSSESVSKIIKIQSYFRRYILRKKLITKLVFLIKFESASKILAKIFRKSAAVSGVYSDFWRRIKRCKRRFYVVNREEFRLIKELKKIGVKNVEDFDNFAESIINSNEI